MIITGADAPDYLQTQLSQDVLSLDRQRSIELALTDTIQTLPDKKREEFLEKLEENLAAIA